MSFSPLPLRGIKIHNVMTNIVGRTRTERIVEKKVWSADVLPVIEAALKKTGFKTHKALIGQWVIEYIGNDDHMHEFFVRNWKAAPSDAVPHVKSYVVNPLTDEAGMKRLLGLRTDAEVKAHRDAFVEEIRKNAKYRAGLRDPKMKEIETYPEAEQLRIALFSPATAYCAEEFAFASINTNYYGQLKSKSSLGPLEEMLIRKARLNAQEVIENPNDVWISMHAGSVEYVTESGKKRGIVGIAPTGTGKSTQGYGLVEAKTANKLHSDDWVFVNLGSRRVLISENQFYMRTNIAEIYPHLIPLLVTQPLENVGFTPDIVKLIESFRSAADFRKGIEDGRVSAGQYLKIVEQMIENNAARSLIDPRLMVSDKKFIEDTVCTDIVLMKRDYDSAFVVKAISAAELLDIMTSKENVFNYAYGKSDPDGYGIPQKGTTEIYYNPYLCQCEVDRDKGIAGPLDRIRLAAYRALASHPEVSTAWINTRLPAHQTQFCIRRYLEGGVDLVAVAKGDVLPAEVLTRMNLKKTGKPAMEGRREMDRTGYFNSSGEEVEVVCFYLKGKLLEVVAFGRNQSAKKVFAYSAGSPDDFFRKYDPIGVRKLFA